MGLAGKISSIPYKMAWIDAAAFLPPLMAKTAAE